MHFRRLLGLLNFGLFLIFHISFEKISHNDQYCEFETFQFHFHPNSYYYRSFLYYRSFQLDSLHHLYTLSMVSARGTTVPVSIAKSSELI